MTKSPAEIFTELTGGCWHEVYGIDPLVHNNKMKCSKCGEKHEINPLERYGFKHPTYSHADDILRRMKEFLGEERYKEFINSFTSYTDFRGWKTYMPTTDFINRFILNTTALLLEAIEFLRSGK